MDEVPTAPRRPFLAYTLSMASIPNLTGYEAGLPANVDAEKTILGAILLDNAAHAEAAEKLQPDDFSLDSHRRIFQRMGELLTAQRAVDIVTLSNELTRTKEIEAVGGVAYLASLTEGLPRRPVIEEYVRSSRTRACCGGSWRSARRRSRGRRTRASRRWRCWGGGIQPAGGDGEKPVYGA